MHVRNSVRILVTTLALVASQTAFGSVVYVNKNASGTTQDGKAWATAFNTVQAGLNACASGNEVWVAQGTYTENLLMPTGVALYGGFAGTEIGRDQRDTATHRTTLDGGSESHVVRCAFLNTVVDGFTIQNGRGDAEGIPATFWRGGGVYVSGGSATIANNAITDNIGDGIFVEAYGSATVAKNAIGNNSQHGLHSEYGALIVADNVITNNQGQGVNAGGPSIITRNVLSRNGADGAYVYGTCSLTNNFVCGNGSVGVYVGGGTTTLTNNTISENTRNGVYVYKGGTVSFANNIVAFNRMYGLWTPDETPPVCSHNDVYANTLGAYNGFTPPGGQGNISLDPGFGGSTGDFHLSAGSPCIDAGDDSFTESGETDLTGKPRILGAHVDIGAHEYDPNGFSVGDLRAALSIAGGLSAASSETGRLNIAQSGESAASIDLLDAVRLARKVVGLEANP